MTGNNIFHHETSNLQKSKRHYETIALTRHLVNPSHVTRGLVEYSYCTHERSKSNVFYIQSIDEYPLVDGCV